MKSYTNLDQSRRLAEILPLESADGFYAANVIITEPFITYLNGERNIPGYKGAIPCWSLAALLDILPSNKNVVTTVSRGSWQMEPIDYLPNVWWCEYEDDESFTEFSVSADNPVDACVAMIEKLHEQKLL